jgi:hypothetical protein
MDPEEVQENWATMMNEMNDAVAQSFEQNMEAQARAPAMPRTNAATEPISRVSRTSAEPTPTACARRASRRLRTSRPPTF